VHVPPRPNRDDLEAALVAGLFLSAGGSGKNAVERNRSQGRAALDYGGFEFMGSGRCVSVSTNEYMTADFDGRRVATFPDMIGTLDPKSGEPVAISELPPGAAVAIVIAHRSKFPVGKGALDPAVFPEVEEAMGVDLRAYL
jgi:DUF917 family protein